MKYILKLVNSIKSYFNSLDLSCKFLTFLVVLLFFIVSISALYPNLDTSNNLLAIQTTFSTIAGYILEKSTSSCSPDPKALRNKTMIVGIFSVCSTLIVILAYIFNINTDNPSLVLIKNLLYSSIGFLTSSSGKYKN